MKKTIALFAALVFLPAIVQAASVVKVTYSKDGAKVAMMVYSGPDGGPNSDKTKYWALLDSPGAAYDVKIKPDTPNGNTATLKGKITVSIEIRNSFAMGTVNTDSLKLVRDNPTSDCWYIPEKELKRIIPLVK